MPSSRQILAQNGHYRSFKVIYFDVTENSLVIDYILQYNNCGIVCETLEDNYSLRKKRKISIF